jgi:hypothetical protein
MTKMTPTVDYPDNTFETPHHRNLKTVLLAIFAKPSLKNSFENPFY